MPEALGTSGLWGKAPRCTALQHVGMLLISHLSDGSSGSQVGLLRCKALYIHEMGARAGGGQQLWLSGGSAHARFIQD